MPTRRRPTRSASSWNPRPTPTASSPWRRAPPCGCSRMPRPTRRRSRRSPRGRRRASRSSRRPTRSPRKSRAGGCTWTRSRTCCRARTRCWSTLVLAALSLFSVSETEFAIRTEFGAIVGIHYAPGLHLKWPWDVVTKFDSRILSQSYTGETFLTNDGRGLIVDFYVKWRVKDPSLYFTATGGLVELAGERLAEIVKDGIKSVVAQRTLQQIVSAERAAVPGQMFGQASRT